MNDSSPRSTAAGPTQGPYVALFVLLALLIMLADQFSKAWFVYDLSSYRLLHPKAGFAEFLPEYFSHWEVAAGIKSAGNGRHSGVVTAVYGPLGDQKPVWEPWIFWRLTTNTGAAWSIFEGNSFALSFVSLIIATVLVLAWRRFFALNLAMTWACGAILGGALGNFIDRFRLHEVVDFVLCRIPLIGRLFPGLGDPYDFPIFNVADACAVCGTIGLALHLLLVDIRGARQRRQADKARAFQPYPGGMMLDEEARRRVLDMRDGAVNQDVWDDPQTPGRVDEFSELERVIEQPGESHAHTLVEPEQHIPRVSAEEFEAESEKLEPRIHPDLP
jgi:signal peptidase II